MADGRVVADISPFLESLRQFTPRAQEDRAIQLEALGQQSQIRDLQLQSAERSAKRQQMTDLATENRIDILNDISDLDFIIKGGPDSMRNSLARLAAEKGEGHEDLEEIIQMTNLATTDPDEAFNKIKANREKAGRALSLVDRVLGTAATPIKLAKDDRLIDPLTKEVLVGPTATTTSSPAALGKGLNPDIKAAGDAAFTAAGGGKDGVKAFNEAVKIAETTQQRADVPDILNASFPNASPAEREQLDAVVQAAKTVESGLKQADKIRTEQRRLKKAKGFQERAIELLTNIINSDQVGDVTGSIEGGIDFRFTDVEAELIADIDEAQNILTAENMDLMTGVLSESDIKLLKNLSSGALNRKRGTKRFKADAQRLLDKLSSELVTTVDDTTPADATTSQRLVFDPVSGQLVPK